MEEVHSLLNTGIFKRVDCRMSGGQPPSEAFGLGQVMQIIQIRRACAAATDEEVVDVEVVVREVDDVTEGSCS